MTYQTIRRMWHQLRHNLRVLRGHDRVKVWTNPPSQYKHSKLFPGGTYSPWLSDEQFSSVYGAIAGHTLVDQYRCYELWTIASALRQVPGDILEVGVWRGGTGVILASAVKNDPARIVYLADTFEGVVKAGEHDPSYIGGEHADTSEQTVRVLIERCSLSNTQLLKGIFPEETSIRVRGPIAMLHCDVDVYESARGVVEWVLPRLSPGGVIVFDDYGFSGCEGVTRYGNELSMQHDLRFIYNLNGHAIFIKQ